MTIYDGQTGFKGNSVTGDQLDTTVLWKGTALPVGAANKIPQNGIFLLVDSLSAPGEQTLYIQTSATLSSPNFVQIPATSGIIGEIKSGGWALASIPTGYLLCNGNAVSRSTYANLFAAISTRFGVGDGSTTFNLPDLRSKFPRGSPVSTEAGGTGGEDTHALTTAELAVHTHANTLVVANGARQSGDGSSDDFTQAAGTGGLVWWRPSTITGAITNAGSGTAHENKPPFQDLIYIIKF